MRTLRISLQIFFLFLFVVAFFFAYKIPFALQFDTDILLKLNPFVTLTTMLASRTIIMLNLVLAIVVVALTIILGRLFCGFFCPLGSLIDFADHFLFGKMRSRHRRPPHYFQRTKYVFMFALVILALFGALFPLYMDPLSFTSRLLTFVVDPFLKVIGTDLQTLTVSIFPTLGSSDFVLFPKKLPLYYGIIATLITTVAIFGGGFWDRRFFCQYVCPNGAFFALLSRFSFFKRTVTESQCNSCFRCARICPVHAISEKDSKKTNIAECIECGECTGLKDSCTKFKFTFKSDNPVSAPDIHRRHILSGVLSGFALIPVFRTAATNKRDDTGRMIRPPGAIPEPQFLGKCTGCGTCIKACPTNTLQPCMFSDGFNRIYTPKVVPRIAGCEEKCTLCGYVCPTGAINKLSVEEKRFVRIGVAILDRNRCIAWEQQKHCLVCDEVCPYNAIESREVDTLGGRVRVPVINEDLCVGCGMCEQHCPVFDVAAIVIYRFGESRKFSAPYMTVQEKERITKLREKSDSANFNPYAQGSDNSGGFVSSDSTTTSGEQKLPDGFLP